MFTALFITFLKKCYSPRQITFQWFQLYLNRQRLIPWYCKTFASCPLKRSQDPKLGKYLQKQSLANLSLLFQNPGYIKQQSSAPIQQDKDRSNQLWVTSAPKGNIYHFSTRCGKSKPERGRRYSESTREQPTGQRQGLSLTDLTLQLR